MRKLTFCLFIFLFVGAAVRGADTFEESMQKATLDYTARLQQANGELNSAREKVAAEKAPLLKRMRAAEDRILAAEGSFTRLETEDEQAQDRRRHLIKDAELVHKNTAYFGSLTLDGLKAYSEELAPGENQEVGNQLSALQENSGDGSEKTVAKNAIDAANFLLARVEKSLGGHLAPGSATVDESNQVVKGTFGFMGPETFFRAEESPAAGVVVQTRAESMYPVVHLLSDWTSNAVSDFFQGKSALIPTDATAGKALRLKQTSGTIWQHIQKGGVVAYVILAVGLIALLLILLKMQDIARMSVNGPRSVEVFLTKVSGGNFTEAQQALSSLKTTTRELFTAGLRYHREPRLVLEERLQAVLLRLRLHYERRLPLLAVIATAAPLMGLLGTVIGMVRTFALITVFGTGNAGKLASGISEVLVTTELGLLVAIPTLIAHGVLSQRVQKNLALLERYALEFVTASKTEQPVVKETVAR